MTAETRGREISRPLVVGLTGPNAAGKGEVAAMLRDLGFSLHSLSDIVREEAAARGLPPERGHLIQVGNELRQRFGPGALAERILPRLGARDVVDSIRNPAEVEVLRRLPAFVLAKVTASLATRFQRSLARARPGDPDTLEAFRRREEQENASDAAGQQLDRTAALADVVLDNDDDLEALQAAVQRLLAECGEPRVL
jgi:dephospho-CoA kinase